MTATAGKGPFLCNVWRTLANSLPSTTIGSLDVSMTLTSALVLALIRFTAEHVMVTVFSWPSNAVATKYAAASVASIFHSTSLVPGLAVCFLSSQRYNPSSKLSDEPVWWQQAAISLIQFCTGYMLYDALLNILWMKLTMVGRLDDSDVMFLVHHLVTTVFMTSNRILRAGHQAAMICMFWGELTNPLHNSMFILEAANKLDCCNGPTTTVALDAVNVAFSALYVLIRSVVAPVALSHLIWNLWSKGRPHLPLSCIIFWSVLILVVQLGSISTIQDCWNVLVRYYYETYYGVTAAGVQSDEL
jgi:hypothetical protein